MGEPQCWHGVAQDTQPLLGNSLFSFMTMENTKCVNCKITTWHVGIHDYKDTSARFPWPCSHGPESRGVLTAL